MNNNLIILIYIIKCSFLASGQNNIEVKYDYEVQGKTYKALLVFNKNERQFVLYNSESRMSQHRLNDDEIVRYLSDIDSDILGISYKNSNSDYLLFKAYSPEEKSNVNVIDYVPKFNWKIHPDTNKTILGYKCVKASTKFRGSEIVAYFTPEIPSNFGPWKFYDLPGLILEVIDQTPRNKNIYRAYEINFDTQIKIEKFVKDETYVSFKKFITKTEKESKKRVEEHMKKLNAKMPRDVQKRKEWSGRAGFEKIYEWEEEEK